MDTPGKTKLVAIVDDDDSMRSAPAGLVAKVPKFLLNRLRRRKNS